MLSVAEVVKNQIRHAILEIQFVHVVPRIGHQLLSENFGQIPKARRRIFFFGADGNPIVSNTVTFVVDGFKQSSTVQVIDVTGGTGGGTTP